MHFFAQVVSGIENVTYEKEYQLLLTNSAEMYERENKALAFPGQSINISGTVNHYR